MKHVVSISMALVLCANILSVKDATACDKHFIALKNTFTKPALMAKAKDPCATIESAEAYLETGTSVDFEDKDGNTPLHLAAMSNNAKFVEFFIGRGAKLEHKNKEGKTALLLAAEYGTVDAAKVLLEHKANMEARAENTWTPLLYAARSGNAAMIELLLNNGVSLWSTSHYPHSTSILHCAATSGSLPAVKAFVEYVKKTTPERVNELVNASSSTSATPLMYAAEWGNNDIVDYLIANGADVNKAKIDNTTALHRAAIFGHASTVEKLLAHGANVNAKDAKGRTPFMYAVQGQFEIVAEMLLAHGADYWSIEDIYSRSWPDFVHNNEFYEAIAAIMEEHNFHVEL